MRDVHSDKLFLARVDIQKVHAFQDVSFLYLVSSVKNTAFEIEGKQLNIKWIKFGVDILHQNQVKIGEVRRLNRKQPVNSHQ